LATEKGLCPALSEIHKRVFEGRPRHVVGGEPRSGLRHRIVRRAGIADYDRVHTAFDRVHEALNDSRLIFNHAQKNKSMLPSHYNAL
jgi:hypothetical protein